MRLWQHRNGRWYILHGPAERKQLSTFTKDRAAAEVEFARFVARQQTPLVHTPTIAFLLKGYEVDAIAGIGRRPVRAVISLKACSKALMPFFRDLLPEHLTPPVIQQYTEYRKAQGVTDGTILRDLGVLRAALKWGVGRHLIPSRPIVPNIVKTPRAKERWLTKDEARQLVAACVEPHVRLFVQLALGTAARSGAIFEARWSQVDWDRRTIDYGEGHGNKGRAIVALNPELLGALQTARQLACSGHIIEWRGGPVRSVRRGFDAACARADLEGVTPHTLRHTAATWMAIAGVPLREIARILGDSEETVRTRYAHFCPDYQRDAVAVLEFQGNSDVHGAS